jgi:hypothetical protein
LKTIVEEYKKINKVLDRDSKTSHRLLRFFFFVIELTEQDSFIKNKVACAIIWNNQIVKLRGNVKSGE